MRFARDGIEAKTGLMATITSCKFFGYEFDCFDLLEITATWSGLCYTLSQQKFARLHGHPLEQTRSGYEQSLSFNVFINQQEYTTWAKSLGAGIMVST